MYKSSYFNTKNTKLIAILLAISTTISSVNIAPVSAQLFRFPPDYFPQNNPQNNPRNNNPNNSGQVIISPGKNPTNNNSYANTLIIPAGTRIAIKYDEGDKILVTKDETLQITLQTAADIQDSQGRLLIPSNTEIVGQIQPAKNGSQFVAEYIILPDNREENINANSRIITRTEIIDEGTNTDAILQGTVIGAAAATILAGITGDTAIATEEVLGGAGLGALAGWLLGGRKQTELISINPNTDLTLILQSDLEL